MIMHVRWRRPLRLHDGSEDNLIYTLDTNRVPDEPGIYVFARQWGDGYEALYVGQGNSLRARVGQQFNNLRLMRHIENARTGNRIVFVGEVITRPGQNLETCLNLVERALIRYFMSEGHDLVNRQGARIRRHEINSADRTRGFVPGLMYLEM